MKKFRLTVRVLNTVIYQAIVSFNSEQYQEKLDYYIKHGLCTNFGILEDLTGEAYDENRDYVREYPDAVVAALICDEVSLFSDWDAHFLKYTFGNNAAIDDEVNEIESFEWTCEPIN